MGASKSTVSNFPEDRKYSWRIYSDFEVPISTTIPCGPFILSASGGSGGINTPTDTTSVGIVQLGTSTSGTGNCAVRTHTRVLTLDGGPTTFECGILIPTLSTSDERYAIRAGLLDNASAAPSNGVYFQYDESASANWQIVAANGGSRTTTTTSTAVGITKTTLKLASNAGGTSVEYFVNGVSVGTIATANVPALDAAKTFGVIVHITKSNGTTARTCDVDWIEATKLYTSPRR